MAKMIVTLVVETNPKNPKPPTRREISEATVAHLKSMPIWRKDQSEDFFKRVRVRDVDMP